MSYTDKEKVENYLMTEIDDSFDVQMAYWLEAVDRFINNYTGTTFVGSNETRYYDGNGDREIIIDGFTSVSNVSTLDQDGSTVDTALTENDDYFVYPLNETVKYKLMLTPDSDIGCFTKGKKRLKVTAVFGTLDGDDETPKDIELAATILAGEIVKQGRDGGLPVQENLGDYGSTFEKFNGVVLRITEVKSILNYYKILEL